MDKNNDLHTIGELARRAGVSVRTIRYYIDEGLLPQPEVRGKYAWFDESYLHRLKLIQQLKDAYLPLKEIRARLEQLTAAQVKQLLDPPVTGSHEPSNRGMFNLTSSMVSSTSAANYLKDMLEPKRSAPLRMGKIAEEPNLYAPPLAPQPEGETWQRITLAPGIELHIKHPLPTRIQPHLRRLVAYARSLFEGHISTPD